MRSMGRDEDGGREPPQAPKIKHRIKIHNGQVVSQVAD
jgi:hypothetical protein